MDSARPVLLTKTSEAASEGRTSSAERAVTVMRKDDTVLLPTIEAGHDSGARRTVKEPSLASQIMSRPCPLLNENLQMSDTAISWLGEGTEYLVIGAVGRQGVGKSTVMSMLAGQAPFCPIKDGLAGASGLQGHARSNRTAPYHPAEAAWNLGEQRGQQLQWQGRQRQQHQQ